MANTGRIRYREVDSNPYSSTFGQEQWGPWEVNESACPIPATYFSALVEGDVARNDCPSGQYGSVYRVRVSAGTYTSKVSQADADQQALDYFEANKQTIANQNGTCSYTPVAKTVSISSGVYTGLNMPVTITRSDSSGNLTVYFVYTRYHVSGKTDTVNANLTIPDGAATLTSSIRVVDTKDAIEDAQVGVITSTTPATYTF